MNWFLQIALLLALTSCQSRVGNQTAAQEAEVAPAKPAVVVVPLIDHSGAKLRWDLSEEFTNTILSDLSSSYTVRVAPLQMGPAKDPFGLETAWIKNTFKGQQFVIFTELLDHEEVPFYSKKEANPQDCSADLLLTLRVRVFDVRGDTPKPILQEFIRHKHFLPRQFTSHNFHQTTWEEPNFDISPVGMAHQHVTNELADHVHTYITQALKQ